MSPSSPPPRRGSEWPSRPPPGGARKRPWYLVAALIGAWVFGAGAMNDGCSSIAFYKTDRTALVSEATSEKALPGHEDAFAQIIERYFAARDAAKNRLFPLAAASLLLGAAMWGLAAAAMSGRAGARGPLLQVVAVRAAVIVVAYVLTPDLRAVEISCSADLIPHVKAPFRLTSEVEEAARAHAWLVPAVELSLHLTGYGLVLLALTRRRTREFYEASGAARSET